MPTAETSEACCVHERLDRFIVRIGQDWKSGARHSQNVVPMVVVVKRVVAVVPLSEVTCVHKFLAGQQRLAQPVGDLLEGSGWPPAVVSAVAVGLAAKCEWVRIAFISVEGEDDRRTGQSRTAAIGR